MKLLRLTIISVLTVISLIASSLRGHCADSDFAGAYSVNFITMHDGLSHNFVDDLFRDSRGYVWIATSASLARYDGYEYVNFTPNSSTRRIKSSFVRKVTEDHHGRLWIVSDGGIDVIRLDDLSPVELDDKDGKTATLGSVPASYVSCDQEGNIWMRNVEDVICISFDKDGEISEVRTIPHATTSIITTAAIKPLPDTGNCVWTVIGGKICRLSLAGNGIESEPVSDLLSFDPTNYVSDYEKTGNYVWIATDRGLYRYDLLSGNVRQYTEVPGVKGSLSKSFVTCLAVSPAGDLMAGSLNGLNIYDSDSDSFYQISASQINRRANGLNNNFINALLVEDENVWVGTEGSGINLFTPRRLFSTMLRHSPSDPGSISANPVNAIYEDGNGTLWIGTVEGGLNRGINGYENGFTHYTYESGALSHNSVSAITADHKGHLWIGTWGGGLCMLDKSNPTKVLKLINTTPDGHRLDYIGTLAYDPFNNALWIGGNSGIFIYDLEREELTVPFKNADKIPGSVTSLIAPDGNLWIGGLEGILFVNLKKGPHHKEYEFKHHVNKLDDPTSEVTEKVNAIILSHDGGIWVGTNGNGLYRYESSGEREKFVNYSTSDGLPNDMVHGIAEDPHGNLWIATYHGLACMTSGGRFLNFGLNNGLDTEQFYWNAYRRLANGDVLFGSVDGLLVIKGIAENSIERNYPVKFTSLSVGDDMIFGNPVRGSISENERSFGVGFSAFDYAGGGNGRYYYRMKGYEDEWKELPAGRHGVEYMNLSPGTYSLEVKYVGEGAMFDKAPVSRFEVEIIPNFYKRWWFILLVTLAVLAVVWYGYRWRVRDLKRQRNELKKAVDIGVKEISGQKALIEEHARELIEQNRELTLRNHQINEQKTQLSEMARQVQKLTADRISFFTNITHEFRTPITLIIGPIERALKLSTNPKVIEQLNFVERNSRYLLSLINQLMDFRKIESGKMEVITSRGNIRSLVDEIILPFRAYAEERGIRIRALYHLWEPVFAFNEDTMRKVLTNLLGNAIKFTPDNGVVTVYASLFRSHSCSDGSMFYLCVSDTGCGISDADTDKVFDHFYQGKSQIKYPLIGAADSGIGLYLCRRLVEVYGGTITARNNHGAGCSFRMLLPVNDNEVGTPAPPGSAAGTVLPALRQEEQDDNIPNRRLTVLVVEDNDDMRGFMRSVLSDHYKVEEATNGEEALKILLSKDVDFIISDLMMPVMDGIELAGRVKENFTISHIPFIMLTAKTSPESRMEGYRKGVDDYILKPFDEEMLLTRIHNILANKQRYQRRFVAEMKVEQLEINEESRDMKFVNKAMEVVRENYTNSYFEVGEFAEALGVSRSLLNKKLQSLLGQSPNQLVRSYRLKLAHELILQNRTTRNLNISEIAFQVGFNDSKYFTRCFTKHFGVNPSVLLKGDAKN